jgi:hypothetical protein
MKKLILLTAILITFLAKAQEVTYSVNIAGITGTDTTKMWLPVNKAYTIEVSFSGLSGTSGTLGMCKGNKEGIYTPVLTSALPYTILTTSKSVLIEQSYNGANSLCIVITKGTLSTGTATITLKANDRK